MKQNETMNKLQNAKTSDNTQSQGNKNKNKIGQRRTEINNENENKNKDDNKVSKITDALTVVINRINTSEKLIRPSSKISVKESSASDLTPTTTFTSAETTIATITQCTIKKGIMMIIRDKT